MMQRWPTRRSQALLDHAARRIADRRVPGERGNVLVTVLSAAMVLGGLLYSTIVMSVADLRMSEASVANVRTLALAQAGAEQVIGTLRATAQKAGAGNPLDGVRALFAGGTYTPFVGKPMTTGGKKLGEYTVSATAVARGTDGLDITIDATGYYPATPKNTPSGGMAPQRKSIRVTMYIGLERSRVFDYAYFINNWGWFYGNTITCNGNARSNGQFDVANYKPTITGQPTYDSMAWTAGKADLLGYHDDNKDGKTDGNDGGIFAGWSVVGAGNVGGNGGKSANQHSFQPALPMPNLTDLSVYEAKAKAAGSYVKNGATTLFTGVYGDDVGEKQNIYLVGTAAAPIEIHGTVVVRGSVIVSGVITGQGAIYAGGNVYVPNNLTYSNPPTSTRPTNNTEAQTEAWITANKDKDFVGLLARENVVLGNHLDSNWRKNVSTWLADPMNQSKEDAGEDQIPNTYAGKDGKKGTADDDVLEGDGKWTVQRYTAADEAAGLVPAGKKAGDAIPGSGEDIDGDGVFDDSLTVANLDFPAALAATNWGGNLPASPDYSKIASTSMTHVDGVVYTNHALAWVTLAGSAIDVNGAVVSRNECMIYGGKLNLNYDSRLLAGNGDFVGDLMPRQLKPIEYTSWMMLDHDPNRSLSQ